MKEYDEWVACFGRPLIAKFPNSGASRTPSHNLASLCCTRSFRFYGRLAARWHGSSFCQVVMAFSERRYRNVRPGRARGARPRGLLQEGHPPQETYLEPRIRLWGSARPLPQISLITAAEAVLPIGFRSNISSSVRITS